MRWEQVVDDIAHASDSKTVNNRPDNCGHRSSQPVGCQEGQKQVDRHVVALAEWARQKFQNPPFKRLRVRDVLPCLDLGSPRGKDRSFVPALDYSPGS